MNQIINVELNNEMTMSSLEIAKLVESRHADVRRSIERLANQGVISLPPMAKVKIQRERREENTTVYQFSGDQGKRDSIIVVAQLSPEFTARLVDRWQELEQKQQKQQFVIPQTLGEALRLAADLSDRNVELTNENLLLTSKIEQDAPKLEVYDAIIEADSGIRITEFARVLSDKNSIGRNKLYSTLREWKILDRNNIPFQRCIDAGWFYVVERPFSKGGYSGINIQVFITGKGQSYVFKRLKKENLIDQ